MSSPGGSSNSSDAPSNLSETRGAAANVRGSASDLMRQVLEETLAQGHAGMTEIEWQAVRRIAALQAARDVDMDQVAFLLVDALLATRFPNLGDDSKRQPMSSRIANSLCGDPSSMQRLKTFWVRLKELVP